jgi:hypothetical protein
MAADRRSESASLGGGGAMIELKVKRWSSPGSNFETPSAAHPRAEASGAGNPCRV